jgi:hypothetical protein
MRASAASAWQGLLERIKGWRRLRQTMATPRRGGSAEAKVTTLRLHERVTP